VTSRFHFSSHAAALATAALLACSAAWAADTGSTAAEPTMAERLDKGRELVKAKRWRDAIGEFRAAVKSDPGNADAHNLLAYSYRKQAKPDLDKAFEHYRAALKIDPKHKGAHEYIGEAYLMSKQPAEAQKHLAILETLCGNKTCEEYADLAGSLAAYNQANAKPAAK
jgi:Tfp pilus assembly protein PilF